MKGLAKALNRLATHESSRASVTANKKEDCRMSDSYSGCKHNPARNRVAIEALKDIAISNYVPESNGEIHRLFGEMYTLEERGTELLDGVFLMNNGDYHVVELKESEIIHKSFRIG